MSLDKALALRVWPQRDNSPPRVWWAISTILLPVLVALMPPQRWANAVETKPKRILITAPPVVEQPKFAGGTGKGVTPAPKQKKAKRPRDPAPVVNEAPATVVHEGLTIAAAQPDEDAKEVGISGDIGTGGGDGHGHGHGEGNGIGDGDETGRAARDKKPKIAFAQPRTLGWSCEWPLLTKVRDATVVVIVSVNEDGYAEEVSVAQATHDEFVKTTIRCAMNKRYHPARDENGKPIAGVTAPWPVHYKTYGAEVQE